MNNSKKRRKLVLQWRKASMLHLRLILLFLVQELDPINRFPFLFFPFSSCDLMIRYCGFSIS
jgi:hypothetical protein